MSSKKHKAKKELGQNFLNNPQIVNLMIEALEIAENDLIIEIGPGLGALTKRIVPKLTDKNGSLFAIELDVSLAQRLKKKYEFDDNVKIVQQNILDWLPQFDITKINTDELKTNDIYENSQGIATSDALVTTIETSNEKAGNQKNYKILGSLPYYITSPIIHSIIEKPFRAQKVIIMIQKEVADKILGQKDDSSYLSSFVQTFYDVELVTYVDRLDFDPVPNVDSAVIALTLRTEQLLDFAELKKYKGFLHKAYSNPRKMLNKIFTQHELKKAKIEPRIRAQNYTAQDWVKFYKELK